MDRGFHFIAGYRIIIIPGIFDTGGLPGDRLAEGNLVVTKFLREPSDGTQATFLYVSLQGTLCVCCCIEHQRDDWRLRGRTLMEKRSKETCDYHLFEKGCFEYHHIKQ